MRKLTAVGMALVAGAVLTLAACTWKTVSFYLGGPDDGLDLVTTTEGAAYGVPAGLLDPADYQAQLDRAAVAELCTFPATDPARVESCRSALAGVEYLRESPAHFTPAAVHDPAAFVWLESCDYYSNEADLYGAAQYLRGQAPAVRAAWQAFVAERELALTGWGVLLAEFRDGALAAVTYQPYASPAYRRAVGYGCFSADDEYADHPEANGIAAGALLAYRAPTFSGSFALALVLRLD